jgi:pseudaminic acid synthase
LNIKIGNRTIGENQPAFIVAELSCNHRQNFDLAVKTIKAMKESGADAIKLSTDSPSGLTLDSDNEYFQIKQGTVWDGTTLYKLYQETDTPWEWQPKLKKIAEDLGMICYSTPCDAKAADFLEKELNVPAYKIASFEITDYDFIKYVAKKGKPIIISTGIAFEDEIKDVIDLCRKAGNNQIIILKCTSSYPTDPKEMNLLTIPDIKKKYKVEVGLSDHSLSTVVPAIAVTLGAKVIEKHFILDRNLGGPDALFSLEPIEFKEMVGNIREVEKALGKVTYDLSARSKKNRQFSRSLFVTKDIKEGESLTNKNIRSIRPGFGLHPKFITQVIGSKAKKDLMQGTPLEQNYFSKETDAI